MLKSSLEPTYAEPSMNKTEIYTHFDLKMNRIAMLCLFYIIVIGVLQNILLYSEIFLW